MKGKRVDHQKESGKSHSIMVGKDSAANHPKSKSIGIIISELIAQQADPPQSDQSKAAS